MCNAVVKGFATDEEAGRQSFVAYLTPKPGAQRVENEFGEEEEEYQWVREYTYRVDPKVPYNTTTTLCGLGACYCGMADANGFY